MLKSSCFQTCPVNLWAEAWHSMAGAGTQETEDLSPVPMPSFINEGIGADQWLWSHCMCNVSDISQGCSRDQQHDSWESTKKGLESTKQMLTLVFFHQTPGHDFPYSEIFCKVIQSDTCFSNKEDGSGWCLRNLNLASQQLQGLEQLVSLPGPQLPHPWRTDNKHLPIFLTNYQDDRMNIFWNHKFYRCGRHYHFLIWKKEAVLGFYSKFFPMTSCLSLLKI